jgi:cytochrome o ubiquinol oxidase subunit 2
MKTRTKIWLGILLVLAIVALTGWYLQRHALPVLQPAGQIGIKERNLMAFTAAASLLVVTPVFILMGVFAWKYRERPRADSAATLGAGGLLVPGKAKRPPQYHPDEEGNWKLETVWWLIPTAMMVVISAITWRSSYALDPFKQLASSQKPLHVQVVAMDWKWLFIYPDQKVASVNYAPIPAGRPVTFDITSDTVMSSFWVPSLGGQMYAMPGMDTQLNLQAAKAGTYNGSSANIGGKGFADMKFQVAAMDAAHFNDWARSIQQSSSAVPQLDTAHYTKLAEPGTTVGINRFKLANTGLYDTIVMKYMMPTGDGKGNGNVTGATE